MIEELLKVLKEKAQELSNKHWGDDERHLIGKGIQCMYAQTESIIRSMDKSNGWIPCSERLPEGENQKIIVSAIWDGYEYTTQSYFYHGKFYNKPYYQIPAGEIQESYTGDKVIAWMPLPKPYDSEEKS